MLKKILSVVLCFTMLLAVVPLGVSASGVPTLAAEEVVVNQAAGVYKLVFGVSGSISYSSVSVAISYNNDTIQPVYYTTPAGVNQYADFTATTGTNPFNVMAKALDSDSIESFMNKTAEWTSSGVTFNLTSVNPSSSQKMFEFYYKVKGNQSQGTRPITITNSSINGSSVGTVTPLWTTPQTLSISGSTILGGQLSVQSGYDSYKWYTVDDEQVSPISGASSSVYTIEESDVGKKIKAECYTMSPFGNSLKLVAVATTTDAVPKADLTHSGTLTVDAYSYGEVYRIKNIISTGYSVKYNGADVTGTYAFKTPNEQAVNGSSATVIFTPTKSDVYNSFETTVDVTVNEAQPTLELYVNRENVEIGETFIVEIEPTLKAPDGTIIENPYEPTVTVNPPPAAKTGLSLIFDETANANTSYTVTVTYPAMPGQYAEVTEEKSFTLTADEDLPAKQAVEAAMTKLVGKFPTTATYSQASSSSSAKSYIVSKLKNIINDSRVNVEVIGGTFTASIDGTSSDPDGTDGSFVGYKVKLSANVNSGSWEAETAASYEMTIAAKEYSSFANIWDPFYNNNYYYGNTFYPTNPVPDYTFPSTTPPVDTATPPTADTDLPSTDDTASTDASTMAQNPNLRYDGNTVRYKTPDRELVPYYIDANGREVEVTIADYDAENGELVFVGNSDTEYLYKRGSRTYFSDISTHWARSYIEEVSRLNLFIGTSSGKFSPDLKMSYGMLVTVLGRMSGDSISSDSGYGPYTRWADAKGITKSLPPLYENDQLSRQDAAVLLMNFARYMGIDESRTSVARFLDGHTISSYAVPSVATLSYYDVIKGRDTGNFDPFATLTRAETAVLILNVIPFILDID